MIKQTVFALSALLIMSAGAQAEPLDVPAGTYKVDPTHASLTWKVSHIGLSNYTARFTKMTADLTFDPAKLDQSKVSVTVDPKSIRTDYPFADKKDFDKNLSTGEEWFNAGKHPEITFVSTKVEMTGPATAKVTGDLTLLGVTKPVVLDVKLNKAMKEQPFAKKPALGFSGTATIKRSDFGMTKYVPMIGDEVQLLIEAEFLKS
ncbi:MAG: YceI family protein [Alphaproteobacteria bacterium]|nr:YceI family protein [Alphaproteobacteria bacterium]